MENTTPTNFQACADLKIEDIFTQIQKDGEQHPFTSMFALQREIQETVYGYNWNDYWNDAIALDKFVNWNWQAIQDEWRELWNSFGGVKKYNLSFWKVWKGNFKECQEASWNELPSSDKYEAWFELIDILHFFFNQCHAMNISYDQLFPTPVDQIFRNLSNTEDYLVMREKNIWMKEFSDKAYRTWSKFATRMFDVLENKHQNRLITMYQIHPNSDYNPSENGPYLTHVWKDLVLAMQVQMETFIKLGIMMGMTEGDFVNFYYSKNTENRRRQQQAGGY